MPCRLTSRLPRGWSLHTLCFPCGLGREEICAPQRGTGSWRPRLTRASQLYLGIRHPSDAGRHSRLLDVPGTLLRGWGQGETVPAGAAVFPARWHTFSPIPDSWMNGFRSLAGPLPRLGREKRSGLDRRAPRLFPLSHVHGLVILSLVSRSRFQFSCLIYSMQKSH